MSILTDDISSRRWYLILAVALVMAVGAIDVLQKANKAILEQAPLAHATAGIKLKLIGAQLSLEKSIGRDRRENIQDMWRYLDQADWYVRAILEGGKNSKESIAATDDPRLQDVMREILYRLSGFKKVTKERWNAGETFAIDTQSDQRHDVEQERGTQKRSGRDRQSDLITNLPAIRVVGFYRAGLTTVAGVTDTFGRAVCTGAVLLAEDQCDIGCLEFYDCSGFVDHTFIIPNLTIRFKQSESDGQNAN